MNHTKKFARPLSSFVHAFLLLGSITLLPEGIAAEPQADPSDIELLDFEVWQRERGYWFGEYTLLNATGNSNYAASDTPTGGQYNYRKYYGFINLQVKGSELKQRNIFLRPALDLAAKDLNADGTVSINELDQFGFTSPFDYEIDLATKIAIPMQDGANAGLQSFNYTEATEKTFTANQTATDLSGNLNGSYFGIPTTTTIIGDDTVLYRVGAGTVYQNQLTTLPGNGTRVRTAQGFYNGVPTYASYYRETRFEDDVNEYGIVTKSAREKFLEKLAEFRALYNVPETNQTQDVETFFTTGLEEPEPLPPVTALGDWRNQRFTADELLDAGISGNSADPDGDGMDNLLEYALVGDPINPDVRLLPELVTVTDLGGVEYLGLRYRTRIGADDITYSLQSSVDLATWLPVNDSVSVESSDNGDGSQTVTMRLDQGINEDDRRFLRLQVSTN